MSTQGQREELEAERHRARAATYRAHRLAGLAAAVLVLAAIVVAVLRIPTTFGVPVSHALAVGARSLPWLLLILAVGALFSLGASRLTLWLDSRHRKHDT